MLKILSFRLPLYLLYFDNKRNNIKKTIDPLTKIAELKFVTFCFMPKNNKGFLYKK